MPCSTCTLALHVVMRATAQNCEALRCGQSEWRITSSSTLWNASALTSMLEAMPYCTCKLTPYVVMRATARNCEACWCYDCGEALKIEFLIIVPESWSSALIKSLTHSSSTHRLAYLWGRNMHLFFSWTWMRFVSTNQRQLIWRMSFGCGEWVSCSMVDCCGLRPNDASYMCLEQKNMSAITIEALTSRVYADFGLCAFDNSGLRSICN